MRQFLEFFILVAWASAASAQGTPGSTYRELLAVHEELQDRRVPAFTPSVVLDSGALVNEIYADQLMEDKRAGLARFEERLAVMAVQAWPREKRADFLAVKSLLNGYRFNLEVLRPWKRDPGFYLDPLMRIAFSDLGANEQARLRLETQLAALAPRTWRASMRKSTCVAHPATGSPTRLGSC